jgi:putative riboflavin transport system substrate-binding protein
MNQPVRSEVLVSVARPRRRRIRFAAVATFVVAIVAGCTTGGGGTAVPPSNPPTGSLAPGETAEPSVTATKLVIGLGYIPSVQFAQFYLAQQNGYYADAGLDVEFQNRIDPDLITLVGQGSIDVGIGDGTSVIPAVSNGIPVAYIATIYGQFPNIVFAKASSGITTAADLKGKKVGVPGRFGSGWIMLQALLASADLTTADIEIVEYPDFTQELAVELGAVDAATGFVNNEPVQLELHGDKASILRIDEITPLPGPGLVAGTATLDERHDTIAAFVTATLQAMEEIKANPTVGLDAAIKAVPELAKDKETQSALLAATIATWTGPTQEAHGLGAIDRAGWEKSITFVRSLGITKAPVTTEQLVREDLLPAGG